MTLLLLSFVACVSCDTIHEFPYEDPVDPTLINVNIELNLLTKDLTNNGEFPIVKTEDHTWRLIVEAYRLDNQNTPVLRKEVILNSNSTDTHIKESLKLALAKYHIVVWMDHVATSNPIDKYYKTIDELRTVTLKEPLEGNTDHSDCFYGNSYIDLTPYQNQWEVDIDFPIDMQRPVAKYILVTNDIEKFISIGKSATRSKSVINQYTAKIFYQGFQPNGIDAYTGKLNDAKMGLWFSTTLNVINEQEAIIGFKYPMSNGPGSESIVSIQIFNDSGELINEVEDVRIPHTRGELTVIRSDFLTRSYSGPGITIDPDFDGTIDVTLPD